ncbi:MAG: IPT/TIG domain-containing protein, partial [Candidatus Margulisiibacteriota bacterium]
MRKNNLNKLGGIILGALLLVASSSAASALAVGVSCSSSNTPANSIYDDSVGETRLAAPSYVQMIQSSDTTAGDPDSSGLPSGDTVVATGELSSAGQFSAACNISTSNYVYIRIWKSWTGSGTPTGYYGTSTPANVGIGFAYSYKPASFATITEYGTTPQTITLITPDGGEYIKGGSSYNITWSSTGTIPLIKIQYSSNGGGSYSTIIATTENDGTYSWSVPATNKTSCYVRVFDAADGTPIDTSEASFMIDSTGPQISSTSPSNSSTDQAVSPTISTIFSSDSSGIDSSSLTATNLKVSGSSSGSHTTAPTYTSSTRTVTFNQSGTFTRGETVTCTIEGGTSGVKDNAGNTMTASYTWSFTVIEAPTISSITWNTDSTENIFNQNHIYGTITISGSHFGDDPGDGSRDTTSNRVKIGGILVPDIINTGGDDDGVQVYYWDNGSIVCGIPSNEAETTFTTAGIQTVEVTSAGYVSAQTSASTIEIKPMVYGVTPSSGDIGNTITIEGTAFGTSTSAVSVSFNGASTVPVSVNNTSLTVTVPPAATTGQLTVIVNGETSNLTYSNGTQVKFTVTSEAVVDTTPVISSIEWKTDTATNILNKNYVFGTIQINGSNFGSDPGDGARSSTKNNVKIGGIVVPDTTSSSGIQVYSWDSTTIVCGIPLSNEAGTAFVVAGNNTVEVTVDSIPNVITSATTIEIKPRIYGVSPWSGTIGSTVTIEGTAYGTSTSNISVSFNGAITNPAAVSNTSLRVIVPPSATTGQLSMILNGKTSNLNYDSGSQILFTVTGEASTGEVDTPPSGEVSAPIISSISPISAYIGQTLTLSGSNFGSSETITIGGVAAVITNCTANTLTCSIPTGVSAGSNSVVVTNSNGTASSTITVSSGTIYLDDFEGGSVGNFTPEASGYYTFGNGITPDNSTISTQGPTTEAAYADARGMKVKYSFANVSTSDWGG